MRQVGKLQGVRRGVGQQPEGGGGRHDVPRRHHLARRVGAGPVPARAPHRTRGDGVRATLRENSRPPVRHVILPNLRRGRWFWWIQCTDGAGSNALRGVPQIFEHPYETRRVLSPMHLQRFVCVNIFQPNPEKLSFWNGG